MIRVFVADDHPVVLRGVRYILGDTSDITVVGEAMNAQELLDNLRRVTCDAIVMDLTMPGSDGLELVRRVKQELPATPILVLSMHSEDEFALRVLKAGAAAFVPKESAAESLVDAIRTVCAGRTYVTPTLAERLVKAFATDASSPHDRLSNREYQVLRLVASGRTASEIADTLSLSVKTVSTYRSRLLEKLRLRTTADLIAYAIRNRLAD